MTFFKSCTGPFKSILHAFQSEEKENQLEETNVDSTKSEFLNVYQHITYMVYSSVQK